MPKIFKTSFHFKDNVVHIISVKTERGMRIFNTHYDSNGFCTHFRII